MGMFDDIIVPKSYLRGLLTKEQEKLLKTSSRYGGSIRGIDFQTKSLENALAQYKVYRQTLFINNKSLWNCEPPDTEQRTEDTAKKYPYEKGRWDKVGHNGSVNFYTSIKDKDKNMWWVEFEFIFRNGVIDKKELIKFEVEETAKEVKIREEEEEQWAEERQAFRKTFKYKFFSKLFGILNRFTYWLMDQTITPNPKYIKIDRQRAVKYQKKLKDL